MNYQVQLLLMVNGEIKESNFEAHDIKVGERFLSFEMEETKTSDGYTATTVNTSNFPYEHIMQFNVKKGVTNEQ